MEMQLTDFENAAFTAFIVLLTRVILVFDLNLYIPISRVDANMQRAHSRNASAKGKFFFRRHMGPLEEGDDKFGVQYTSMFSRAANGHDRTTPLLSTHLDDEQTSVDYVSELRRSAPIAPGSDEANSYEEMTMAEIMTGKGDYFPGLIPLIYVYLDYINCDKITRERLKTYLDFIEGRAVGVLVTPATWMRNYVRTHPAYRGDSVVSDEIA
jgi:glutamate--cysteine ligase catalytic subunit